MSDFTTNFISWSWSSLTRNTTEWIAKLLRQMCFLYRFSEACQKTWKEFFSFTKATRIFKIRHKIKIELFLQENLHFLFHYRFFYCLWTSTFFSISFHLIWLFYYFNIFLFSVFRLMSTRRQFAAYYYWPCLWFISFMVRLFFHLL